MTPEFKKQWFRKKAHELPADAELVSCVPLGLVLEMFGIGHIDFLSLDVEVMHGNSSGTKVGGPRTGHLLGFRIHSTSMISVHTVAHAASRVTVLIGMEDQMHFKHDLYCSRT